LSYRKGRNKHLSVRNRNKAALEKIAKEKGIFVAELVRRISACRWMKRREEVVVAGGGKIEGAERAAVNGNDIVEPQGHIGKIVRPEFSELHCIKLSLLS